MAAQNLLPITLILLVLLLAVSIYARRLRETTRALRAESTRRALAEQGLWQVAESGPNGKLILDSDAIITRANAAAEAMLGYDKGELTGLAFETLIPERFKGDVHELIAGLTSQPNSLPSGTSPINQLLSRDGRNVPASTEFTLIPTTDGLRILVSVIDASLQRRVDTSQRLRADAVLTSMQEGIMVVDKRGRFIFFNEAAQKIFGSGQSETDLPPGPEGAGDYGIFHADGHTPLPPTELPLTQARQGHPVSGLEMLVRNEWFPRGIPLSVSAQPVFDDERELIGAVAVLRDTSKEKELLALKDEFVAMAAHELRTPMTAIKGLSSMIVDGDYGQVDEALKEPLQDILSSSETMIRLINDILEVSRMDAGKLDYTLDEIEVGSTLDRIVQDMQPLAQAKDLVLRHIASSNTAEFLAKADRDKLRQVLTNLVGNAIKFTHAGEVSAEASLKDNRIEILIRDTGIGIDNRAKNVLFQKFHQEYDTIAGKPTGTGLGLYISRELIRGMNGELWLEQSQPGAGSCFAISLPEASKVDRSPKPFRSVSA